MAPPDPAILLPYRSAELAEPVRPIRHAPIKRISQLHLISLSPGSAGGGGGCRQTHRGCLRQRECRLGALTAAAAPCRALSCLPCPAASPGRPLSAAFTNGAVHSPARTAWPDTKALQQSASKAEARWAGKARCWRLSGRTRRLPAFHDAMQRLCDPTTVPTASARGGKARKPRPGPIASPAHALGRDGLHGCGFWLLYPTGASLLSGTGTLRGSETPFHPGASA